MDLKLAKKIYIITFFLAFLLSGCGTNNPNDIMYKSPTPRYNTYQRPPSQQIPRPTYGPSYQAQAYQSRPYQTQPRPPVRSPYAGSGYQSQPQPQPQPQPSSRYYSNPYDVSPQNPYPSYDSDQYYVAPSYYGTTDINVPDGGFEKF